MAIGTIFVSDEEYNRTRNVWNAANARRAELERQYDAACAEWDRAEKEAKRIAREAKNQDNAQVQKETERVLEAIRTARAETERISRSQTADTQEKIDEIRRAVAGVKQEAEKLNGRIQDLSAEAARRFQALVDAETEKKARAKHYAEQFWKLLDDIRLLHPDKLMPGVLEQKLEPVSGFLEADLSHGDLDDAIGLAQTNIPEAMTLRAQLELENERFRTLKERLSAQRAETRQHLEALRNPDRNREEICTDPNRNLYDAYDGRIDYWSNGWFSQIEKEIGDCCQRSRRATDAMALEDMERCILQLRQADDCLTACGDFSKAEFGIFSLLWSRVCDISVAMTERSSWELMCQDFPEQDPRRACRLSFDNGNGKTASFVVLPDREMTKQGKPGGIQFAVNVSDGPQVTDSAGCEAERDAVIQRLERFGIPVGQAYKQKKRPAVADRDAFLEGYTSQGDRSKQQRLENARQQMPLRG